VHDHGNVEREGYNMQKKRLVPLGKMFVLMTIFAALAHASPAADSSSPTVRMHGNRLWVNAQAVPLADILFAVAKAAQFDVVTLGDLSVSTTVALDGVSVDEAIETLAGIRSTVVVRAGTGPENRRPVKVWVFGDADFTGVAAEARDYTSVSATAPTTPEPSDLPTQLTDSEPDMRIAAIQQLYGFEQERAITVLGEMLDHDEDAAVRSEALRALTNIGGEAAFAAVTAALGDELPRLRREAVQALVSLEPAQAVQYLGQVVLGDPDPGLREDAVEILSRQHHPAVRALLLAATDDRDERVRQAALASLHTANAD
jgi:HEAT repeat protein